MPDAKPLTKAQLIELNPDVQTVRSDGKRVTVQFNPETLKVTYANQISPPRTGEKKEGDKSGTPSQLFVGAGSTKLTVQLWFDATTPVPPGAAEGDATTVDDVGRLTSRVAYFITPTQKPGGAPEEFIPPAVRFHWGSFVFDGIMDSLEQSLEFFSPDGRPLRASMTLSLSQQKIQVISRPQSTPGGGGAGAAGTRPLSTARAGASLQSLVAGQGKGGDWQAIATANGIENPRLLPPGKLIDLNASPKVSF